MRVREFRCKIERKEMQNESRKQVASQCICFRAGANRRLENTRTNLGACRTRSTQHIATVMVVFQSYSAALDSHVSTYPQTVAGKRRDDGAGRVRPVGSKHEMRQAKEEQQHMKQAEKQKGGESTTRTIFIAAREGQRGITD